MNKNLSLQDLILISSYLDDRLSPGDKARVETRLEQDQLFRLSSEGEGVFGGYDLLPALLRARTEGLDLRLRDATKKPLPWVFGPPAGEGVKGQGKK